MRRQLNREETYTALYWFYIDGKDLGTIAKDLNCSIYDLSPWITEVGTRIILGLPEKNPELHKLIKLLDDIDRIQSKIADVKSNNNQTITDLLRRVRLALCHYGVNHETDKSFLHISDIRYREACDLLYKVGHYYHQGDLKETIEEVTQFLADDTPTNTTDDTYTEGVTADGAAILKDGVPLTITQILDILNGRTRR